MWDIPQAQRRSDVLPAARDPSGSVKSRRRTLIRGLVAVLVSAGLLAALLSRIDVADATRRFSEADPRWIGASAILSLAVLLLRGLRFAALAPKAGPSLTIPSVAIQVFLNRVTPFRLGEVSLPLLLRRHAGEDAASALVGVFFVRLLDLALVVFAVAASLALRAADSGSSPLPWIVATLALTLVLGTFRRWLGTIARLLHLLMRRLSGGRSNLPERLARRLVEATADGRRLDTGGYAVVAITSIGIFAAQTALFGCILAAFGIGLPVASVVRGAAIAQAGAAAPFAIGSFGTQEASWVAGFTWVGVSLDRAIVTGLAAQLFTLAFAAAYALPAWLWLQRRPLHEAPGMEEEGAR